MFAHSFRFNHHQFQSRMRSAFEPRKPRHPLLRFVLGVVGLGVLALLVMFSVFVGAAMIAVGLIYRLWSGRGRPLTRKAPQDPRVVEGEYQVVDRPVLDRADERPAGR
ncbi:hypothetical protein [Lysobacter sp. D1-1-M9]|uniref:hypothetical protein n=1 Tax=Novilysobacter longmucuonensis TaxID=3098603 RepID=UPI002FC72987